MGKYYIFIYTIIFVILFGCKKETSPNRDEITDGKKYPITFSVGSFTQEIKNLSKSSPKAALTQADELKKHIKYLHYFVFDEFASLITRIDQDSSYTNFGSITDSLPLGEYTISLLGTNQPINLNQSNAEFSLPSKDAFAFNMRLFVTEPLNQRVDLDRIMAEAKFIIYDRVPVNATSVNVRFSGVSNQYNLVHGQSNLNAEDSSNLRYSLKESDKGKMGLTFGTFITASYPSQEFSIPEIRIDYKDQDENSIGKPAYIRNVRFVIGSTTVMSGNIMSGADNSELDIAIPNPEWSKDSIKINF